MSLRCDPDGKSILRVEDNGIGIPADIDIQSNKSLGMRLVRSLTRQIGGSFELSRLDPGTLAQLQFTVNQT
jgi:two-component sensor histidine kinase